MTNEQQDPTDRLIANEWLQYDRVDRLEARMYVDGESFEHISLSPADNMRPSLIGGMIARNPDNHYDQWYIAPEYFAKHYRHAGPSPERMVEALRYIAGKPMGSLPDGVREEALTALDQSHGK